jgi:hypothetical protein
MLTFKWDEGAKACVPDESDKPDDKVNTIVSKE